MNDDIKDLLGGALGAPPPTAIDSENATTRGRVALGRRRRGLAGGGIAAALIAGALTVSVAMNTIGGDGGMPTQAGASPSASASGPIQPGEPPYGPPVALDAGKEYRWTIVDSEDDPGRTDRYWNYVTTTFGVERPANGAHFVEETIRLDETLGRDASGDEQLRSTGFTTTRLVLRDGVNEAGYHVDPEMNLTPGSDTEDVISMELRAPGSWIYGDNASLHDVSGLGAGFFDRVNTGTWDFPIQAGNHVTVTTDAQGGGDDSLVFVKETWTYASGGSRTVNRLVIVNPDGSLVVITDEAFGPGGEGVREPTLSRKRLEELATGVLDAEDGTTD